MLVCYHLYLIIVVLWKLIKALYLLLPLSLHGQEEPSQRTKQLSLCYLEEHIEKQENKTVNWRHKLLFMSNNNNMYSQSHCMVNVMFSAPSTEQAK